MYLPPKWQEANKITDTILTQQDRKFQSFSFALCKWAGSLPPACFYCLLSILYHPMQAGQRVRQPANLVNQPKFHRLLAVDHTAYVGGQFPCLKHQFGQRLPLDPAVGGDKLCDTILNALKIIERLGYTDDQAVEPKLGGSSIAAEGAMKGPFGRNRQRNPIDVAPAQPQGKRSA